MANLTKYRVCAVGIPSNVAFGVSDAATKLTSHRPRPRGAMAVIRQFQRKISRRVVLLVAGMLLPGMTACAQLAITETLSAAYLTDGTTTLTNNSDFWELTNFGTNTVNLAGYRFSDKAHASVPLPPLSMAAGESVLFVRSDHTKNAAQFRAWWGSCVGSNVQMGFFSNPGLSSYGDSIQVYDPSTTLVDSVDFGVATRGVSFTYNPNTGKFGVQSVLGQGGTCRAAAAPDIASPGKTSGPIPLSIVEQPMNFLVCADLTATFKVEAVGMPRPRYQWVFNGVPIPGANKATLTISNASAANAGIYRVTVTNGLTTLQSSNALLTFPTNPAAPSVVAAPADVTLVTNRTARFSISACGFPFPTYQWYSNGVALAGATNRTLFVANCRLDMSGAQYCVRTSNSLGVITNCARLYVTTTPILRITEIQAAPVTSCGDEHHDWFEVTNFGTNAVDLQGYRFSDAFNLTGSEKVKQTLVVQPNESVVFVKNPVVEIFVNWWGVNHLPPGLKIYPYGGFSLGKDGDELYLWPPTAEDPDEAIDSISFATNAVGRSLRFDKDQCNSGCDSVEGEFGAFRASQCGDIGSPGYTTNPVPAPPIILTQPGNLTVRPGGNASFSPGVYSVLPLTYQWRRNGINLSNGGRISGATNSVLIVSNLIDSDAGLYSVRISNTLGSTLSSNATLTVSPVDHFSWAAIPSPQVTFLPIATTVTALDSSNRIVTNFTGTVLLSASAANTGMTVPVSPAISGTFVAGIWSGTLSISQAATNVVLRADDGFGNVGSSAPFNTVEGFGFILQPTNQNVLPGTNVTLVAAAVGIGPVRYQWRYEGVNIPGATNYSYSFPFAALTNHGRYDVVASDDVSTFTSSNAFIYVLIRPGIVLQPLPQSVIQGGNALFVCVATGAPPIFYRWLTNGVFATTTTSGVFVLSNAQVNVSVRAHITNLASSVTSQSVALTVLRDFDGDGLPDPWEVQYGFNTNNAADALEDFDADGMSNRDEYLAGTNPTNALSVLKLLCSATNPAQLTFAAQTGLTYTVQWRTNLVTPGWTNLTSVTASPTVRTVLINTLDGPPGPERYFRVVTP